MQVIGASEANPQRHDLDSGQGRDPEDVHADIRQVRAAAEAIRNERVAALGPDPDCPVPIP